VAISPRCIAHARLSEEILFNLAYGYLVHTLPMDFTQRDIYSSLKEGLRYTYESGVAGLSDG
jgi:hypothetical protein